MKKKTNIFTGVHFDAKKQVEKILMRRDARKKAISELCEEAFNKAVQECQLKLNRVSKKEDQDQHNEVKKKHKKGLYLASGDNDKPATLTILKSDVYFEVKKKISYDDISLVVDTLFAVMKRYVLRGIRVRIEAFFDIGLAPFKPVFVAKMNKWRTGVMRLKLSSSLTFRKQIQEAFPTQDIDRDAFENPHKSDF